MEQALRFRKGDLLAAAVVLVLAAALTAWLAIRAAAVDTAAAQIISAASWWPSCPWTGTDRMKSHGDYPQHRHGERRPGGRDPHRLSRRRLPPQRVDLHGGALHCVPAQPDGGPADGRRVRRRGHCHRRGGGGTVKARRIALCAVLTALALGLSYMERFLPLQLVGAPAGRQAGPCQHRDAAGPLLFGRADGGNGAGAAVLPRLRVRRRRHGPGLLPDRRAAGPGSHGGGPAAAVFVRLRRQHPRRRGPTTSGRFSRPWRF